ncbi:MAG TPA: glycosyltransferase [Pyrinomonadaceae bacterium]|nr:glycosyltransferase [Pyrinomonadaceae bacterium]
MRILISSRHRYPAKLGGIASHRVYDDLAQGLAELGHVVYYQLGEVTQPLPEGVRPTARRRRDVDIWHLSHFINESVDTGGKPWVRTYHAPNTGDKEILSRIGNNFIFVSRSQARSFASDRFVLNGIVPSDYVFSETKDDYFLFMVKMLERAELKGLPLAIVLAEKLGFKLTIAGSSENKILQGEFAQMCRSKGIEFVGEVSGARKADLIAGAKGLLFPTMQDEPFGLVIAEALISGTPVICSDRGACRELMTEEVGFVCADLNEYERAIGRISEISPKACREKALKDFHYLRMADDYVKEYGRELG